MREVVSAPPNQEFRMERQKVHNIKELYDILDEMSDEEFSCFVGKSFNHFAAWIEHSLNSKFLAAKVRRTKTRADLKKVLFMELYM